VIVVADGSVRNFGTVAEACAHIERWLIEDGSAGLASGSSKGERS